MGVKLPCAAGFRRWMIPPAWPTFSEWLGKEVAQRYPDLVNGTRLHGQWVLLMGYFQASLWYCWLIINLQNLRDGVRTQEMQNPFSPRSCSSENPQHLAHVWSQERYGLPWQLSLLRDGAAGFMSHRENILQGFAKILLPSGKIFTHIILNEREIFEPFPEGLKMFDLIRIGQNLDCWKHCLLFCFLPSKWKVIP